MIDLGWINWCNRFYSYYYKDSHIIMGKWFTQMLIHLSTTVPWQRYDFLSKYLVKDQSRVHVFFVDGLINLPERWQKIVNIFFNKVNEGKIEFFTWQTKYNILHYLTFIWEESLWLNGNIVVCNILVSKFEYQLDYYLKKSMNFY